VQRRLIDGSGEGMVPSLMVHAASAMGLAREIDAPRIVAVSRTPIFHAVRRWAFMAWLALLALAVGPTVSRALMSAQMQAGHVPAAGTGTADDVAGTASLDTSTLICGMTMQEMVAAGDGDLVGVTRDSSPAIDQSPASPHHDHAGMAHADHLEACGLCVVAAHTPPPTAWHLPELQVARPPMPALFYLAATPQHVWLAAQPRGPPTSTSA